MTRTWHRYSFDPIRRMFRDREDVNGFLSDDELAVCLGTTRDTVLNWRRRGVSEISADKLAVSCGTLPCLLWAEWMDHGLERAERSAQKRRNRTVMLAQRRRAARRAEHELL